MKKFKILAILMLIGIFVIPCFATELDAQSWSPPITESLEGVIQLEPSGLNNYQAESNSFYNPDLLPYWFFEEGNNYSKPDIANYTPYTDIHNHWAGGIILTMIEDGVFKGKSATNFGVDDPLTRAEFYASFTRVIYPNEVITIQDDEYWGQAFLNFLMEKNLINSMYSNASLTGNITPIEINEMLILHGISNNKNDGYGGSLDISFWVSKNVFPTFVFQSGSISRAIGASVLHELLYPEIAISTGIGYLGYNYYTPDAQSELSGTSISHTMAHIIQEVVPISEYDDYRVMYSFDDIGIDHALTTFNLNKEDIQDFAISYDKEVLSAYAIVLITPTASDDNTAVPSTDKVLGGLEQFINTKTSSLYEVSDHLYETADTAVLKYLINGTIALIMGHNAEDIFSLISEKLIDQISVG